MLSIRKSWVTLVALVICGVAKSSPKGLDCKSFFPTNQSGIEKLIGKDYSNSVWSLEQSAHIADQDLKQNIQNGDWSQHDSDTLSPRDIVGRIIAGVNLDYGYKSVEEYLNGNSKAKHSPRINVYVGRVVKVTHREGFFIAEVEQSDGTHVVVDSVNQPGTSSHYQVYVLGKLTASWFY